MKTDAAKQRILDSDKGNILALQPDLKK